MSRTGTPAENTFQGQVTVSSVIIDQLSSGLYESPAACLKELVNNSYDADATDVILTVRPDASLIVIDDNGTGMSRLDFETHFRRIARSHKRDVSDTTDSGRPKVGKIGIGFVAANEICERLEIVSTKKGSTELLHVTLDFEMMRKDADQRRKDDGNVSKADYYGEVSNEAVQEEHYTRVFLTEVKPESMSILDGTRTGKGGATLYGATASDVRLALARPGLRSWSDFDLYTRSMLEIGLNVPVPYYDDWADQHSSELTTISSAARKLNFNVVIDGTVLRKPTVLQNPGGRTLLRKFKWDGESVAAHGYLYAQDKKLTPIELNGSLIRIRNAAVGGYDGSYLGYPGFKSPLFQDWVSVEIYADDRLEDALNIDRRTLRVTHPAYVELQEKLHSELDSFFAQVRKELYGTRSVERKASTARVEAEEIKSLTTELASHREGSPALAKTLREAASAENLPTKTIQALSRTYKASDVIRMVRYAANDAGVSGPRLERLISTLTETLLRS